MVMIYSDDGLTSSIDIEASDGQFNLFKWQRKALIAIRHRQVFQQTADTSILPKHYGKSIKKYEYIPMLDDRNVNDQGIDAANVSLVTGKWHLFIAGNLLATEANSTLSAGEETLNRAGHATQLIAETVLTSGWVDGVTTARLGEGNLYGGSKDVGVIGKRLPALSEQGGLVNRIGFSRTTLEGSIEEQGFYSTYTEDSIQFDTDSELLGHIVTESLVAANELVEDNIQLDLLNAAGVTLFAGGVTVMSDMDGNAAANCIVEYKDLLKMNITLDDNRCPKNTKLISGSRLIDTRVVNAARFAYIGSEVLMTLESMKDLHDAAAWKSVETYAQAGMIAMGEEGAIGRTRFVVAPEMMSYAGAGDADAANDQGCATTTKVDDEYFDVCPILFIGSGAYSTITFQSSGKSVKFSIIHKKPGVDTADAYNDPYGKLGFYSIRFWYGTLILRPEWIGVIYTCVLA